MSLKDIIAKLELFLCHVFNPDVRRHCLTHQLYCPHGRFVLILSLLSFCFLLSSLLSLSLDPFLFDLASSLLLAYAVLQAVLIRLQQFQALHLQHLLCASPLVQPDRQYRPRHDVLQDDIAQQLR